MHPVVKPALRRGWRDRNTVQFGMTPAHAMTLSPVDTATGSFLDLLDGTRGLPLLREEGRRADVPARSVDALVARLARAGLVDDARGGGPAADALRDKPDVLERLRPDLASLSLLTREPGAAPARLAARRALRVRVRGAGRVGALLASVLSGAGVGGGRRARRGPRRTVGRRAGRAARRGARRPPGRGGTGRRPPRGTRPAATPRPLPGSGAEDPGLSLVIFAPRDDVAVHAPDPFTAEPLMAAGTPHLYAGVVEGTGIVGPLVLPGETGCAGCLHQDRTDRDPAWPRLVAQWRSGRARRVGACDLTLATAVAGLAAAHALAFLDGGSPSGAGTRWEVSLPGLTWRNRPVPPHPDAAAGAAERGKREHSSTSGRTRATMAVQRPSTERRRTAGAARPTGTWRAHV